MSNHYNKILKTCVQELWDTLGPRERTSLVNDLYGEFELSKWFSNLVHQRAKAKFEDPNYSGNDPFSFKYSQY